MKTISYNEFREISPTLSGVIFNTAKIISEQKICNFPNTSNWRKIEKTTWLICDYLSFEALDGEEKYEQLSPPFYYSVVIRRGKNRILILSKTKKISQNIEQQISKNDLGLLKNTFIKIDDLAKVITANPETDYLLTYANAYYSPFGNSLKFIAFYGNDLAEANIFRKNINQMMFNRCGIRNINNESELLKLGNDGSIQFNNSEKSRLHEVDMILKFINDKGLFK
ncbi:hypothetical protein ACFLRG_00610 [Bacteroidota bacterium]